MRREPAIPAQRTDRPAVPVLSGGCGPRPGLDLTSNRALQELLDVTVVGQPNHLLIGPGPRHLAVLRQACDDADATGDLVPDAVLAAVATEHGCTIATVDRDVALRRRRGAASAAGVGARRAPRRGPS